MEDVHTWIAIELGGVRELASENLVLFFLLNRESIKIWKMWNSGLKGVGMI